MTLAQRITRLPLPHDADIAADLRTDWGGGDLADLVANTASASPFLREMLRKEGGWLRDAVQAPEDALREELARDGDLAGLPSLLRQMKRRVALLAALADLGGVWTLEEVTGALTALADRAVDLCVHHLVQAEIRRGKLPDLPDAAGMVVLAMGKMGAGELNYSSDIDLVCLFDDAAHDDPPQARTAFIRATRRMAAMLSDNTAEGYVFRTDLRLRPDAAVTPVCLSIRAAESYYEAEGRTWERAAYIKARPCGGDIAAGRRFLSAIAPFVWRKHLDFATIDDTYEMRLRIRDHKGLNGPLRVEGHDMKLGRGGIRDIEFYTQTRQLISGGRDPSLRVPTTVGGLAALSQAGWITPGDAAELTTLYRAHREVEHRLQMIGDQQTHRVPVDPDMFARAAHLSGQTPKAFHDGILERLTRTADRTEAFFAPAEAPADPDIPERMREIVTRWAAYPALRSSRAQSVFRRLRPQLLARLHGAPDPERALLAFDGFLRGLPSGVQIFSLFDANPQLVDLLVDIASMSPDLAEYLSRNAQVLDAVIVGDFFAPWPGEAALQADLTARLRAIPEYEGQLDAARRWMKDHHFRIGVHHLRGLVTSAQAGAHYADLAGAVIAGLWPAVVAEFSRRHGPPPGRGAVMLGMGSLGAGRLHAKSDLDLLIIHDSDAGEESSGPKPLVAKAYYARLTQALLTALTAQTAEGHLYSADMRLRPSGRQGPVATALAAFETYQMNEAWTWEHLALTRARPIAGDPALTRRVEALRREVLTVRGKDPRVPGDVADMRRRLAAAKPPKGPWDVRNGPGRLMDLELLAEFCALDGASAERALRAQLDVGLETGRISADAHADLVAADTVLWHLRAAERLLGASALTDPTEGVQAFLFREVGTARHADLIAKVDWIFRNILSNPRGRGDP
ncbi:glutamine-synthetase adenylyltransferase [Falsirhodobacter halotolerans]|uniref:[protein-PII] uridylyltransferase family protein n=1 Tax=Falsirhodobacter halotolerans TaxID=1146892 RepID=UPI001FD481CF|nr:glutamine-synthetase adenylyltransferase [Falsirhodobacter halotolerans]MCJ8139232.1 glutamine-synthetase adenylyltransferase [Falsirhodobacter halotolerans]